MRAFTLEELPWLRAWRPDGLVLPLGFALTLADQKQRGLFELPSLSAAIVVLTSPDETPLADHHRDLLWYAFRVPVFEHLCGPDGRILAAECEVHDGLHLCAHDLMILDGELIMEACACGLETPRLRNRTQVQSAAAAG
jgi:hypothetical protein